MSAEPSSSVAWIALGANLGNRGRALAALRAGLEADGGARITAASSEILTRPVGMLAQPDFHNQVVRLESPVPLPATAWLERCHAAETSAGRKPTIHWGPRRADADLLLLGARAELRVDLTGLVVPHPALPDRPFLWRLLAEIDPELRHADGWLFGTGPIEPG